MDISVGCDPEIFVKKDGNLVSAYGLIQGTKETPFKVNYGAVQVDGMALEFNTVPASQIEHWTHNISTVLEQLRAMVPGYEFAIQPTAHFGKEYIEAQPDEAKVLGCDPDYNAYTGEVNSPPKGDTGFRTASGHIHVGWTKDMDPLDPGHFEACRMLTKQLDVALGIPSLIWDRDNERRQMYGGIGAFRPKPYGVEYRVLSNAWLNSPLLIDWIYKTTVHATQTLLKGTKWYETVKTANYFTKNSPLNNLDVFSMITPTNAIDVVEFFKAKALEIHQQNIAAKEALLKEQYSNTITSTAPAGIAVAKNKLGEVFWQVDAPDQWAAVVQPVRRAR